MNRLLVWTIVCCGATLALGQEVPADGEIKMLTDQLKDEDVKVRRAAAEALGKIGIASESACEALLEALRDEDFDVATTAAYALGNLGTVAVPELIKALEEGDAKVRGYAAFSLGNIGPAARDAVPALLEALGDREVNPRVAAIRAIGRIGSSRNDAVSVLIKELSDADKEIRRAAAYALGNLGTVAVPELIKALSSGDAEVRYYAAVALGDIGPPAEEAVPVLIESLEDKIDYVRRIVAMALSRVGPAAVPALINALEEGDAKVRVNAAFALGNIGPAAREAVPELVGILAEGDSFAYLRAAEALISIANGFAVKDVMSAASTGELERIISKLKQAQLLIDSQDEKESLASALYLLELELRNRWWYRITNGVDYVSKQKWAWLLIGYAFLLAISIILLVVWPRGILRANQFLKQLPEAKIKWPVEMTLSVRHLFLMGFFYHRCRVLDAWVKQYAATAQKNFYAIPTVVDRTVHVEVPVSCDGSAPEAFAAGRMRSLFRRNENTRVLIRGQGGAGKTSLACQLGKLALESDRSRRLALHLMLPVLIENDLGDADLIEVARGELQSLIGEANPIAEEWFNYLLRKKRVVLIVDHLSEMSESSRSKIQPREPDFPVGALIVTSRIKENLGPATVIEPCLLKRNRVSDFVVAYLSQLGKADLFEDDEEYFNACRRLSEMVGDREVTVLLAKLYIEQLIKSKEQSSEAGMPASTPELMLRYVDELHPDGTDPDVIERVREDVKKTAWECVKESFYPVATDRDKVIHALKGESANERLDYLESKLRLLAREQGRTRFVLDPIAEYLAGLRVVEMYKGNEKHWRAFLRRADSKAIEKIRGFLLAVRDCCLATGNNVPGFVSDELGRRGGLDAEFIEKNRLQQRIKRLINQLRFVDKDDRLMAIKALEEIGSMAKEAVPLLVELLRDDDTAIRDHAIYALSKTASQPTVAAAVVEALKDENAEVREHAVGLLYEVIFEVEKAVPMLVEALRDKDENVRRGSVAVLGRIGPKAQEAVPALVNVWRNGDGSDKWAVVEAVGKIGPTAKDAVPLLIETLRGKEMILRCAALDALKSIGPEAKEAVPVLIESLRDREPTIRYEAAKVLGRIGPSAAAAVPVLRETIGIESDDVKKFCDSVVSKLLAE